MSGSCSACGAVLRPGASFCPSCGSSVVAVAPAPTAGSAGRGLSSTTVITAGVIAVVALIGVAAGVLLSRGGDDGVVASGGDSTAPVTNGDPTAGDPASGNGATAEGPGGPEGGGSSGSAERASPAASDSGDASDTDPSIVGAPPAVPSPSEAGTEVSGWIAQLGSFGERSSAEERRAEVHARDPSLVVEILDSSQYASLAPDYYVTYVGPFMDGPSAYGLCGRLSGIDCIANYVSQDRDDCPLAYPPQQYNNCS